MLFRSYEPALAAFGNVAEYCRSRGFEYFLSTVEDLDRTTENLDINLVLRSVRSNPELIPIHENQAGVLYRVLPKDRKQL